MRIITALLTAALAATLLAAPIHQEKQLADGWRFSRDGQSWTEVTVPHDWAIGGPFDKKWDLQIVAIKENGEDVATEHSGRSGGLPWIGHGTYTRQFTVPAGTQHAELVFDGAMADPKVYVNDRLAGGWAYGYNAFIVDVTPYLNGGANTLRVELDNLEESNRWYPGAGIYRPVTLVTTAYTDRLDHWGLFVSTAELTDSRAKIDIRHEVADPKPGETYRLKIEVTDPDGRPIAATTTPADGTGKFHATLDIANPMPWSPETPNRYAIATTLLRADGTVVDTACRRFGIRTVSVTREHGFQLNGKSRKFKGVCLHHDLGPLGAAVNRTAIVRQIEMLKEMGADAIRTSHNMPSTIQMDVCDSLGMMVMAESFDAWHDPKVKNGYNRLWNEWWQRDITNLVRNHRNHPSIVMWSVGNEIPEQWKPEGAERYKKLIQLCHALDPTRPVTCGMDNPDADLASGFSQVADVPGYNYRTHRYEETFPKLPQGFLLGSETASTISTRGYYAFPDSVVYNNFTSLRDVAQCSGYDTEHCWWSNLPDDDWRLQDDMPWTIGEFVWTGFDYLGEPTPYDDVWPARSSYFGIIDLAGIPKDRYYLYRSHWNTDDHTLHLLPHWTWPGREGKVTPVYCYTDVPSAELFVNGKSQGRITKDPKTRLDRYRLRWRNVKYEPGELKVVAYDADGNQAGQLTVRTAGKPDRLTLDTKRLIVNTNDIAFVTVSLVDKNGTLIPYADDQLTFEVGGAAAFKAVCNGDATSVESFTQPTMRLFNGQLVVVIQTKDKPGTATLRVTDRKNGKRASLRLKVE